MLYQNHYHLSLPNPTVFIITQSPQFCMGVFDWDNFFWGNSALIPHWSNCKQSSHLCPSDDRPNIPNRNDILGNLKTGTLAELLKQKDIHELLGIYAIILPKCFNSDFAHLISPLSPNLMWFQGHPFVSWLQIKPFIQESYFQKDLENGGFQAQHISTMRHFQRNSVAKH